MNKDDIRKGFINLKKLRKENVRLHDRIDLLRGKLAVYESKEIASTMQNMGFTHKEALAAIAILHRSILPSLNKKQ